MLASLMIKIKIRTMTLLFGIVLFNIIRVRMIIIGPTLDIGNHLMGERVGFNNTILCMLVILNSRVSNILIPARNKESSRIIHTKAYLRN